MTWDVVIVGGGPGGMQAAIAAASEGLKTLVLEKGKVGGQIGQTPKLENSVFAPAGGVTGPQFAQQMREQADRMGVIIATGEAAKLTRLRKTIAIETKDGTVYRALNAVLAMGSAWHDLDIPGLKPQINKTVHYGPVQCLTVDCVGQEVAVYGGGPSAGQAIIELAGKAKRVHVLMRSTLKMPQYLVDRIHELSNVTLYNHTKIVSVAALNSRELQVNLAGESDRVYPPVSHLFMCSGLVPATKWLKGQVGLDDNGRIKVGGEGRGSLETSIDGVFAIGDCRAGSTPRVGVAIGDGSMVVTEIWNRFMRDPVCSQCHKILA